MSKALELSQLANNLTITEGTDTVTLGQANVVLSGNLQVDGTSTTLNTSTLTVDDLNITIADGAASAAAADGAGLTVDGANATLIYGSTNDNWSFNKRLDVTGDVVINSSGVHASGCLQINNSSTTNSFPKAIEAYNSGIGVGHRHQIMLGKDGSNYDTSTISFYYAGSASTSNRLEFGFWNAGSLLNVQADGNVGIGTASPAKKLHIRDSIPDIRLEDTDTNAVVDLKGNTGTGSFVISTDVNNAIADSKIIFEVDNDEKVRINANGDVGIGTNDPSNRLEVAESFGNWRINDYGGMMFHNTSDANNERFIHGRSSGVLSIGYVPIANLTGGVGGYGTQAYDQMTILTNGNVGIGTTTIGSRLHVHGTGSDGQEVLEVTSAGNVASAGYHWMTTATAGSQTNTNSTMIMYVGQALSNKNGGYLGFNYQGASSDASFLTLGGYQSDKLLNVRMDGKVGIGTTNPSQILEAQTAGTTYITASTTGTGTSAGHRATAGTNDWVWFATQGQSNLRLYDYSSSVVRLTIENTGHVGIGTEDPDRALHIEGSDFASSTIRLKRTGGGTNNDAGLQFQSAAGANADTGMGGIWFQNSLDGNAYALIRARTDDATGTSGRLDFMTSTSLVDNNTSPSMTIASSGNVGIGTNSPGSLLTVGSGATARGSFSDILIAPNGDNAQIEFWGANTSFAISHFDNDRLGIYSNVSSSWDESRGINIQGDGDVGIGTTNPTRRLHVQQSAGDDVATFINADTTNGYGINVKGGGSASGRYVLRLADGSDNVRMLVLANGNVGIGTTDPTGKLEVYDAAPAANTSVVIHNNSASHAAMFKARGERASANQDVSQFLTDNSGKTIANIRGVTDADTTSGRLEFWTAPSASNAVARMTVDSAGNVGIGTTDPSRNLYISGGSGTRADVQVSYDALGTTASDGAQFGIQSVGAYLWNFENSALYFATNNTERMRIEADGDVGIGTTVPGGKLDIQVGSTGNLLSRVWNTNTSGTGSATVRIANSGNNAQGSRLEMSDNAYYVSTITGDQTNGMQFYTGQMANPTANLRMTLDINGDVGIGTNTPAANLHLHGTGDMIRLTSTNDGSGGAQMDMLHFSPTTANEDIMGLINMGGYYTGTTSSYFSSIRTIATDAANRHGRIEFLTRDDATFTTKMTIDHLGNVGIGTTSPSVKLHVVGGSDANLYLKSDSTRSGAFLMKPGTNTVMGSLLQLSDETYRLGTASNYHIQMNQDGKTILNATGNNVGIGTASPGNNLTIDIAASNTGITLSDHGDGFFPQIIYDSNRTSAGQGLGKFTSNWNGTEVARIEFAAGADTTNKDDGEMLFYTKQSGVALAERMRIDDVGFIGIGTNSPSTKVHIYDSGAPRLRIQSTSTALADTPGIDLIKRGNTTNGVDLGVINWYGNDALGNDQRYAYLFADAEDTASGSEDGRFFMTVARGGGTGTVYYEMRGIGGSDNPLNAHHEFRGTADGHIMHVRRDVIDRGNSGAVMAISLGENTGPEDDPWIDFYNYGTTGAGGENQVNGSIGTVNGNQGTHIWGYETLMLRATTDTDMPALSSTSGTGLTINSTSSTFYGTFNAQGISNFNNTTASTSPTTGSVIIDGGLGVAGDIHAGADVTAFSASDQRLKTNLQPIENSLNKVKSLTGYTFNWNELAENKPQDQREAGILAQDVEAVLPEVTTTRDDGYKAVRYEKMVPMLIEAIKELSDKVDAQQQEIERLRKWQ